MERFPFSFSQVSRRDSALNAMQIILPGDVSATEKRKSFHSYSVNFIIV